MLTNNGINALGMNRDYTFTNVIGEEYAFTDITGYSSTSTGGYSPYYYPLVPYAATTGSNDYTEEQGSYTYKITYTASSTSGYYNFSASPLIYVGTGTDEVTADDYKLSSAAALTPTAAECKYSGTTYNTIRTFINDTEEDITVTEMGLYLAPNKGSTASYAVLIAREVLSSPVTIGVGETYTFTYTLNLGLPSEA